MRQLLLVSNSKQHGYSYLEHCAAAVQQLFAERARLLFVPYALHDLDGYADQAAKTFAELGLTLQSVHRDSDPRAAIQAADGIFIGGGNTFRLVKRLHEEGLVAEIHAAAIERGVPYMGTSAGANVACATICTTNDMPIVYPPTFDAIGLVPFQINAHYLDPDPLSTHMGETRDTRIREFHEEHATPVIGLREGAWLSVHGDQMTLEGTTGARLFRRGQAATECESGNDLSDLLVSV